MRVLIHENKGVMYSHVMSLFRGKLKWRITLHMWNYSAGGCAPTHAQLSPLRQSISNPDMKEAADIVLSFQGDLHPSFCL